MGTTPTPPKVTAPPANPDVEGQMVDPALAQSRVQEELAQQQTPPPPQERPQERAPGSNIGIMQAGRPQMPRTFEQFKAMVPKGEMDPAQTAVLSDMQSRLASKMERAEGQENTAKFDAIMMAGLAMMGGTTLADGIARAAQTGGATYMAGKKDANKAIDAASDAELAFRQYELEVAKGNDKAASDQFGKFLDYSTKLYDIDSRAATAGAKTGVTGKDYTQMANNIASTIEREFKGAESQLLMISDPEARALAAEQISRDKEARRDQMYRIAGIPTQQKPSAGTGAGADTGNRPPLTSFIK
jgi:hypothetical protein